MARRQVGVANSPTITAAAIVNFKKETCQVFGSGARGLGVSRFRSRPGEEEEVAESRQ